MNAAQDKALTDIREMVGQWAYGKSGQWSAGPAVMQAQTQYQTLLAAVQGGGEVDEAKLAASLAPLLVPAVVEGVGSEVGLTDADVERVIRDVLGGLNDPQ